jgi:hypothetical protein
MFFNDANLSTWVRTPTYIYLYPKNDATITFNFPFTHYVARQFYGDDSTNGLREVSDMYSSSRTTKNAELLSTSSTTTIGSTTCGVPIMEFSQSLFNLLGTVFFMLIIFAFARIITGQFDWHGKEFYIILSFVIVDVMAMFVLVMGSQICIN